MYVMHYRQRDLNLEIKPETPFTSLFDWFEVAGLPRFCYHPRNRPFIPALKKKVNY